VLAVATKQINQGRLSKLPTVCISSQAERDIEKFTKKTGENNVRVILQRLDRLTPSRKPGPARMTVTHMLEVVHGFFNNLKVVMDGA